MHVDFRWYILAIIISITSVIFVVILRPQSADDHRHPHKTAVPNTNTMPPFLAEDFFRSYPLFAPADMTTPLEQSAYRDLALRFEAELPSISDRQARTYARYLTARTYISAVLVSPDDTASLTRAIALTKDIVNDPLEPLNIRAFLVNDFDGILAVRNIPNTVHQTIINDDAFPKFSDFTDGSVSAFRENLLTYGNALSRMTAIKMKIALLHAHTLLIATRKQTEATAENTDRITSLKEKILSEMTEADASLQRDLAGQGPFRSTSYLPEPLYYKALVADTYYRATNETPFGDVQGLYQNALTSAQTHFPLLEKRIRDGLDDYNQYITKQTSLATPATP